MAVQKGDGASTPAPKPKPQPTPTQPVLVSEHGKGGGYTPGDTGKIPGQPSPPPASAADNPSDSSSSGPNYGGTTSIGAVDWAAILGQYGLPQDIIDELNRIFAGSGDINQAITLAQAYVRGTPWYQQTYPGIQAGINSGLFQDEQGYRAYTNQINQIYQQYYHRNATPFEVASYATGGKPPSLVAKQFQSDATKANFSDPLKSLLTPEEMQALSDQMVGIDTALGQHVLAIANIAQQTQTLYQNFYGRAATRQELDKLVSSGSDAATIAQQFATQENINGMNPAIRDLFTPEEIKQVALDAAGGISQNGVALKAQMDLAAQLNQIYHQYTGGGVSRQEVTDAYNSGTSAQTIGQQFGGKAYIEANKGDIQYTAGAFGDRALTDPELKSLGEEQAGLDSPLGQSLTAAYQKAIDRMHGAFKGVLASPALSLQSGRLAGPQKPPDTAA